MISRAVFPLIAALATTLPALAQQGVPDHTPYKGLETRAIKALSEQHVDDLRKGRGMSLALAAELNGYPGPLHVIELAKPLALAPDTLTQMRALFEAMKAGGSQRRCSSSP